MGGGGGGGGGGFFGGVAQGIEAARDFQLRKQQAELEKDFNTARVNQMKAEEELGKLQLQSLTRKIEAEGRLPGQMSGLLGPEAAPLGPGMQGPPALPRTPELDRANLGKFLLTAREAGQDPQQLLNLMAIADPRIAAIVDELQPETLEKLSPGETLVGVKRRRQPAAPSAQAAPPQTTAQPPTEEAEPTPAAQPSALTQPAPQAGVRKIFEAPPKPEKTPLEFQKVTTPEGQFVVGFNKQTGEEVHRQYLGQQAETEQKLVNPVDQRVAVLSKGKYKSLSTALDAGQHALAEQAEEEVRLSRPVEVARAAAGARAMETGKLEMKQKMADLDNVNVLVDEIQGLTDNLITAKNGFEAIKQGAALQVGVLTRSNNAAKVYQDTRQAFLGILSRQLGGERGVLTDRDIFRISGALPQFSDTRAMKDFKIASLRLIIATAIDAKKRGLSGEPADPQLKKQMELMFKTLDIGIQTATGRTPEEQAQYDHAYRNKLKELQGRRAK